MAFKFVIISCLVALVRAGPVPTAIVTEPVVPTPVVAAPVAARIEEYDPSARYTFRYEVVDTVTGDVKGQTESRDGSVVVGSYFLDEPDGTRRIVKYTADDVNGFNAMVYYEPLTAPALVEPTVVQEPAVVPAARVVATPTPVAPAPAPVFAPRFAAPFTAAPLAQYAAYQPFAQFASPFTFPGAPGSVVAV